MRTSVNEPTHANLDEEMKMNQSGTATKTTDNTTRGAGSPAAVPVTVPGGDHSDKPRAPDDEDGSVVAEYGLIAIVGATIASLAVKWATGGAIWQLFDAVMAKVRVLLGA